MIVVIFIICLFILLGIIFSMGKGSFLISGYNTMPKKEKEEYDAVSLCKFMGKIMFLIAFCMSLFLSSEVFNIKALFYIGLTLFFVVIIFTLIYSNTGNRFKK